MANKGWFVGCGFIAAVVVVAGVLGIGYFAKRATDFRQQLDTARDRYIAVNRDFPFKVPPNGELQADRFERYLRVRAALDAAVTPLSKSNGPIAALSALSALPDEVSRAQANTLRENSMSLDEYRWISRQLYTTIAAEAARTDPDPALAELRRTLQISSQRPGGIEISSGSRRSSSSDPLGQGMLDFTWLRVPESTRSIIRQHVPEIAKTRAAAMADSFLSGVQFDHGQ